MTHVDRLTRMSLKLRTRTDSWAARHLAAWDHPQGIEKGIVQLTWAAAMYADAHRAKFDSGVGDDSFLGPEWESIVRSIRTLLNGELGRLDGGTLDGILSEMLTAEGFNVDG